VPKPEDDATFPQRSTRRVFLHHRDPGRQPQPSFIYEGNYYVFRFSGIILHSVIFSTYLENKTIKTVNPALRKKKGRQMRGSTVQPFSVIIVARHCP